MHYTKLRVSSGAEVEIRPRTYAEWEQQEELRIKAVESVPNLAQGGNIQEVELGLQRANLKVRNARLGLWVKDFAGKKANLSLRDVAEIEKAALDLESAEIPLGNSGTGGTIQ